MTDDRPTPDITEPRSAFDDLLSQQHQQSSDGDADFTTAFRGYDKSEVDSAISELNARVRAGESAMGVVQERHRRAIADAEAQHEAAIADLESKLTVAEAKANTAEDRVATLTDELRDAAGESANRQRFEEVLHVAEEQASVIIKNASLQADRLLAAADVDIQQRRAEAQADAEAIRSRAEHEAQQARVRISTELTAHTAQLERQTAHAAEKVAQAEREAAAIRTEAEKSAAALRGLVARETDQSRAEADDAVRELRRRALDFEESLTRRQDDAQQEFLALHNQAVAHAERITKDANDQVAASLEHSQRITAKADDFDRLMRAQAAQIDADAQLKAREHMDRARDRAQQIIDAVTSHADAVLRDAEDRTRQLRWQQHQLSSFMADVRELMRAEGAGEPVSLRDPGAGESADLADDVDLVEGDAPAEEAVEPEFELVLAPEIVAAPDDVVVDSTVEIIEVDLAHDEDDDELVEPEETLAAKD